MVGPDQDQAQAGQREGGQQRGCQRAPPPDQHPHEHGQQERLGRERQHDPQWDSVPERVRATSHGVQRRDHQECRLAQDELRDDRGEAEGRDGDQHAVDGRLATCLQPHTRQQDRDADEHHGERRHGR